MGSNEYELFQTNSDVYLRYKTMDAWAKFKDFAERYVRYVQERIANDRELIGWNGTHAAADTDINAFPLLQDVNKGWMQYVRDKMHARILAEVVKDSGAIRIGTGGDFTSIDHVVSDLKQGIPKHLRKDLVVLVGDETGRH